MTFHNELGYVNLQRIAYAWQPVLMQDMNSNVSQTSVDSQAQSESAP